MYLTYAASVLWHCNLTNICNLFIIWVFRAIYFGLGCADDPNVKDYYNRAHGFPTTYFSDDDPEVIEEIKIANAELKHGWVDIDDDHHKGVI